MTRLFSIAALISASFVGIVYCPYDNLASQWDGNTKVVNGVMYEEFCCPSGHLFWVKT